MKTLGILFLWLSLACVARAQTPLPETLKFSPQASSQMQLQNPQGTLISPKPLMQVPASLKLQLALANSTLGEAEKNSAPTTDTAKSGIGTTSKLTEKQAKELAEIEVQRMRDLQAHEKWQLEHIQKTYASQAVVSRGLFWALAVMTLLSLALCLYQFAQGMRRTPQQATNKASTSDTTQIEISANSLKLQSNTMGILLLAFTLAFFYLLVKEVYPISVGP